MRNWLTVSRARGLLRVRPCPCVRAHARPCGVRPCPRVACVRPLACVRVWCVRVRVYAPVSVCVYARVCMRARGVCALAHVCAPVAPQKSRPKPPKIPDPPTPKKRPRAFDVKYSLLHLRAVFNCACFFCACCCVFYFFVFIIILFLCY